MAELVPTFRGQGNRPFATDKADEAIRRGQETPYNINGAPTGAAVADGDYGDIVVSGAGAAWALDPGVITAFSRTVLDDANAAAWGVTLGLQALAYKSTVNNGDWSGADLDITNGGTGASSAATARSNLGIVASNIPSTATGDVAATDVQGAIAELASEKLASTSYTAADVLAKLLTVDGSGSGLDADMLDGQSGAFFLARANHTGTQLAATISDFSTAADARITAAIGVTVQAYDAELAAIAGLVSAADRLPYFTGAGTASLATFTAAGRALVDDADASAQRTTLGLGTAAVKNTGTSGDAVPLFNGAASTWDNDLTVSNAGSTHGFFTTNGTRTTCIVNANGGTGHCYIGSYTNHDCHFGANFTAHLKITAAGAASFPSIGTTASAANAFLDSAAGNNLLRSTSSARYKTAIRSLRDGEANLVLKLRPVAYRSRAAADDCRRIHWGLVAEEVAEYLPVLVHRDAEGRPDAVQYERVIVGLLGVIQRHEQRIAALEAAIQGTTPPA